MRTPFPCFSDLHIVPRVNFYRTAGCKNRKTPATSGVKLNLTSALAGVKLNFCFQSTDNFVDNICIYFYNKCLNKYLHILYSTLQYGKNNKLI